MKKNSLLKSIGIILLILVILSWIIPAGYLNGGEVTSTSFKRMGLFELGEFPFFSLNVFLDKFLFVLLVGGFYGVLSKTGKYRNMLEKIAKSLKGKEEIFIVFITLITALLTAVFDFDIMLFIFIPAIISIILLMGYDKIVAFLATFGATFIGIIGNMFSFNMNAFINNMLNLSLKSNIAIKVALFVVSVIVYIIFLIYYSRKHKTQIENAEEKIPLLGSKQQVKRSSWPLYFIFICLFVILILTTTHWVDTFNLKIFQSFHEWIRTWTIGKKHTVLYYILGESHELGAWKLLDITKLVVLATIFIGLYYKLSFEEIIKAMTEGFKKTLKPALIIILALIVLVITAYHPFFITIINWIIHLSSKFNIFLVSIVTVLSALFNIEYIYLTQSSIPLITSIFTATSAIKTTAIISQAFYGLSMFFVPTSLMLILGLTYLDIPYTEWLKKTWKLLLALLVVIIVIITISVII